MDTALVRAFRRHLMLSPRARSRLGTLAFLALLIGLSISSAIWRPERAIPTFRIEFPDAAFVVEEDWVAPNERAQNLTQFEVRVPRARLSQPALSLLSARESRASGTARLPQEALKLHVSYRAQPKPREQFRRLVEVEGWTRLDDTDPNYRVAVLDDPQPYTTPRVEAYEIKADPRYVVFCAVHYYGGDRGKPWKSCGVSLPFHAECKSNMCTQIGVFVPSTDMNRWAEFGEQIRALLRPFEVEPDPRRWRERERIHRVPVVPLAEVISAESRHGK